MVAPLLTTKLCIPLVRPALVPRPRLTERLNAGLRRQLTLISAPAGFGKTTLISDFALQISDFRSDAASHSPAHPKVAWLSLDDDDNDPVRFCSYVIAALQTVNAGLGAEALALLQSPQPPPFKTVISALINDLDALAASVLLVLDDYHVIESQTIHDCADLLARPCAAARARGRRHARGPASAAGASARAR